MFRWMWRWWVDGSPALEFWSSWIRCCGHLADDSFLADDSCVLDYRLAACDVCRLLCFGETIGLRSCLMRCWQRCCHWTRVLRSSWLWDVGLVTYTLLYLLLCWICCCTLAIHTSFCLEWGFAYIIRDVNGIFLLNRFFALPDVIVWFVLVVWDVWCFKCLKWGNCWGNLRHVFKHLRPFVCLNSCNGKCSHSCCNMWMLGVMLWIWLHPWYYISAVLTKLCWVSPSVCPIVIHADSSISNALR